MELENNLGKDNIKTLVVRLAIPSMLAQFVSVFYSIVDRMYIGNIPEIGELALAGAGVCGPIVTLLTSFSSLTGFGGAPLLSIRMGEKNQEEAKKVIANSFLMLLVIAAVLTVGAWVMKDHLLMWFGTSETTFVYADQYLSIYLAGTAFALIASGMNQFIICQGFAKVGMKSVMLGAIVNLVLDPVFIFTLDMGVSGAAVATVIAQASSAIYILYFLSSKRVPVRISLGGYSWNICKKILSLGFSPFVIIALDSVLVITMNAMLQRYGGAKQGDMMVTCGTIMQSFMLMVTMPLGGITAGTQSILGYNYGSRQMNRVRYAEKEILKITVIFTAVIFLLAQTCSRFFVLIFTRNPEYIAVSVRAIRISTLMVIPLAFQYSFVDAFTGMGIAKLAISLSLFRKTLFFIVVMILPRFMGVDGIFYTEPVIDLIAAIFSSVMFMTLSGRILKKRLMERNMA